MLFEDLLTKYIGYRLGGEPLNKKERDAMWCYVDNYIVGLATKAFKQHNYKNKENEWRVTRHDLRVMSFYDFIDFAAPRGKGARWILRVFKLRFHDLEGLLILKERGYVFVDDIIKEKGISNTITRRATKLAAARRTCTKRLQLFNKALSFEDILPCLVSSGASKKVITNWKRYYDHLEYVREFSNPMPLLDFAKAEQSIEERSE